MRDKPIVWAPGSYQRLCRFPAEARQEAGFQLRRVQGGEEPYDWKPMPTVGKGVIEIRIHDPYEFRVIYVAKYSEAVYVLNAFQKKTRKTARREIRGKLMRRSRNKGEDRSDSKWVKSSGNVFKDLGFSEEESASLLVRADLMIAITRIIDKRGWTPVEAAKALAVKQPRISELRKGKIDKFSVDLLLKYLARLGKRVDFKVRDWHRVA